jgi:outer membrane murein-binding lipoprotein Lpp
LDAKLDTLASLCELASSLTGVDHPLCLDCAAQLREEVEAQVAELEGEIAAYSNTLGQLGAEGQAALSEVGRARFRVLCFLSFMCVYIVIFL